MTSSPDRREQVGAFFAAHPDRVHRAVRRRTPGAGDEVVDRLTDERGWLERSRPLIGVSLIVIGPRTRGRRHAAERIPEQRP